MRLIKFLIKLILIPVLIVALLLVGGYFYVRLAYGIDILKTVGELKTLSEKVDEATLCPNAFTDGDMVDVQSEINKSVEGLITYSEGKGYEVNFDKLPTEMKYVVKLTDKQMGAMAQTILEQETGGELEIGGKTMKTQLLQVDFFEVVDGGATFNSVVKVDISALKGDMSEFPMKLLKKYVPDSLYISSTVKVTKGEPFAYTVAHESLTVNNLSVAETEDLFHTLDKVLKIGEAKELNEEIGKTLVGALVGSETQKGLAYSLKDIGATDYAFLAEDGKEYFSIEISAPTP